MIVSPTIDMRFVLKWKSVENQKVAKNHNSRDFVVSVYTVVVKILYGFYCRLSVQLFLAKDSIRLIYLKL